MRTEQLSEAVNLAATTVDAPTQATGGDGMNHTDRELLELAAKAAGLFDDIENADKAVREFRATHGFTENHGRVV